MALLPPHYLDAVVAIGVGDDPAQRRWIGTGFLFGRKDSTEKTLYHVFLITNKHVFADQRKIYLKFNVVSGAGSRAYKVDLYYTNGRQRWISHPDSTVDVGVLWLNAKVLTEDGCKYNFFHTDKDVANAAKMKEEGVTEGDGVYVLGFPMGMVTPGSLPGQQYVICRAGCVARIRDVLDGITSDFLIDATVFPGNSGGPVVLKPEIISIHGTKAIKQAFLIGIIQSYVPYIDSAYSVQTQRPRITFEENSGLSAVIIVNRIEETVEIAFERQLRRSAKQAKVLAGQQGAAS